MSVITTYTPSAAIVVYNRQACQFWRTGSYTFSWPLGRMSPEARSCLPPPRLSGRPSAPLVAMDMSSQKRCTGHCRKPTVTACSCASSAVADSRSRRPTFVFRRRLAGHAPATTSGLWPTSSTTCSNIAAICQSTRCFWWKHGTWHSVVFQRLHADGYQVIDRPRPRSRADTLTSNHGGVAAAATPGICLTLLDLSTEPASCELLPVRVVSKSSSCVVVVVYRTGSLTTAFISEFSDVLDRVATNIQPLYVVGDLKIRLDRADDPWSRQMIDLLALYGLRCTSQHRRTITAGCSTLLPVAMTCRRRPLMLLTSACLTIGYSGGQRRWSDPQLSTLRLSVDRGARWTLMRSELVCCHPHDWSQLDADQLA